MTNATRSADDSLPAWKSDAPWVSELFDEYLDHQRSIGHVLHLSINGIKMLTARPNGLEALSAYREFKGEPAIPSKEIAEAQAISDLAQNEINNGFPLLHEQATVTLWGSIEALVRRFVALWLANHPENWQMEQIGRLKVRIGDYESLNSLDRCYWVADMLDQEAGGPLRAGASRFESLLAPFGFSGPIPDEIRRPLFELCQVRNLVVHRRGLADKRFLDACPWLGKDLGKKLRVTHGMWAEYDGAVAGYVLELIQRVRVKHGLGRFALSEGEASAC